MFLQVSGYGQLLPFQRNARRGIRVGVSCRGAYATVSATARISSPMHRSLCAQAGFSAVSARRTAVLRPSSEDSGTQSPCSGPDALPVQFQTALGAVLPFQRLRVGLSATVSARFPERRPADLMGRCRF